MTEARKRAAIAASYLELAEVAAVEDGPAINTSIGNRPDGSSSPGLRTDRRDEATHLVRGISQRRGDRTRTCGAFPTD